jgi:hypothetical protein
MWLFSGGCVRNGSSQLGNTAINFKNPLVGFDLPSDGIFPFFRCFAVNDRQTQPRQAQPCGSDLLSGERLFQYDALKQPSGGKRDCQSATGAISRTHVLIDLFTIFFTSTMVLSWYNYIRAYQRTVTQTSDAECFI